MNEGRCRVSVVGASGYGGGELLRLLLGHPGVEVRQASSRRLAGDPVALTHPNLRSLTNLAYCRPEDLEPVDVLFLSLPNGESMKSMDRWMALGTKVVDLGADFRLRRPEDWKRWYRSDHLRPDLLDCFVYGLPEIDGEAVKSARYIAGPGCEAIASILALFPLVRSGLVRRGPVVIDAKMGSSAAGAQPSESSHHPERAGAVRSYKPTGHRHGAEIAQILGAAGANPDLFITATAIEMVRGILVTIHIFPEAETLTEKDLWTAYRTDYGKAPFIRIIKQNRGLYRLPEPKILQGTNYCEIGFEREADGRRLVVLAALDNLVKGAAGNAVQCFNLMSGFPETMGLEFPGLHPV